MPLSPHDLETPSKLISSSSYHLLRRSVFVNFLIDALQRKKIGKEKRRKKSSSREDQELRDREIEKRDREKKKNDKKNKKRAHSPKTILNTQLNVS